MPPTVPPAASDVSAAARFFEEHKVLQADLMSARDEIREYREQLQEHAVRVDLLTKERDYYRARANTYFSYAVELASSLTALIETVGAGVNRAKMIAAEVTREKLAAAEPDNDGAAQAVLALSDTRSGVVGAALPNGFDAAGH